MCKTKFHSLPRGPGPLTTCQGFKVLNDNAIFLRKTEETEAGAWEIWLNSTQMKERLLSSYFFFKKKSTSEYKVYYLFPSRSPSLGWHSVCTSGVTKDECMSQFLHL